MSCPEYFSWCSLSRRCIYKFYNLISTIQICNLQTTTVLLPQLPPLERAVLFLLLGEFTSTYLLFLVEFGLISFGPFKTISMLLQGSGIVFWIARMHARPTCKLPFQTSGDLSTQEQVRFNKFSQNLMSGELLFEKVDDNQLLLFLLSVFSRDDIIFLCYIFVQDFLFFLIPM